MSLSGDTSERSEFHIKVFLDVHNGYLYIVTETEWALLESILSSKDRQKSHPPLWPLIPAPIRYSACRTQVEAWLVHDVNASYWCCQVLDQLFIDLVENGVAPAPIREHINRSVSKNVTASVILDVLLLPMEGMPILQGRESILLTHSQGVEQVQPSASLKNGKGVSSATSFDFTLWETTAFVPLLDRIQRHVVGPKVSNLPSFRDEEQVLAQAEHFSRALAEGDSRNDGANSTGNKEGVKPFIRRLRFKDVEQGNSSMGAEPTVVVVDYTSFSITCSLLCRCDDGRREESLPLWTAPRETSRRSFKDVDRVLRHYRLALEDFHPSSRQELADLLLIPPEGLISPERLQELAGLDHLVLVEDTVFPGV